MLKKTANRRSAACHSAVGPRTDAKLGTKAVIEVGDVSEPAVESDIEHARRFEQEPRSRAPETMAEDVLVGRQADELLKEPQEVVAAKFHLLRKGVEAVVRIGMIFDHAHDSRDARFRSGQGHLACPARCRETQRSRGQFHGNLFPRCRIRGRARR